MPPHIAAQCPPPSRPAINTANSVASGMARQLQHFGITSPAAAFAQVAIEYHADDAHEQSSPGRNHDPVRLNFHQPLLLELLQVLEFPCKVAGEIYQVSSLDRFDT